MAESKASSLVTDSFLESARARRCVRLVKMYYRLAKPGIIYGNLLTAAAGFLLASRWHIDWMVLWSLLGGTALIIASACVLNNCLDREIDRKMARTAKRATVTGAISIRSAVVYAICLGVLGFVALSFTNWLTVGVGGAALFGYVVVYGAAKRRTPYGTLVGTLPGAASLVAGYTAVTGRLDEAVLLLFLIMASWQMVHFYSIAIYRRADYASAGLPVWPVRYGVRSAKVQMLFYALAFIGANALLSLYGYVGYAYLIVMSSLGLYWLWRGVSGLSAVDDVKWARGMFGFSLIVLMSLSVMLAVGTLLP